MAKDGAFRCLSCECELPATLRVGSDDCCVVCWHAARPILPRNRDEYMAALLTTMRSPTADMVYLEPRPMREINASHDAWTRPEDPSTDEFPREAFRPHPIFQRVPHSPDLVATPVIFRTQDRNAVLFHGIRDPFVVHVDGGLQVCGAPECSEKARFGSLVGMFARFGASQPEGVFCAAGEQEGKDADE